VQKEIKKVIFLTIDFPPMGGGMAKHSHNVALALSENGSAPVVIAPSAEMPANVCVKAAGFPIHRLKAVPSIHIFDNYLKSTLAFFFCGLRYCLSGKVGFIVANTWSVAGVAAFLINKITGVHYMVFAHGLDVCAPQASPKALRLMRFVLKNASVVAAISAFTKTLVEKVEPCAKTVVIHPIADLAKFTQKTLQRPKVCEGRKVILTVGRLVESKNHEIVINAMPEVIMRFPDAAYIIIGEGPEEKALKSLAFTLGLSDKVIFLSCIEDNELASYYYSCDLFVMASREILERGEVEGFGIVFLEAALCGKPAIGGRSGGISDALVDGVTGILVDPMDKGAVASTIIQLLTDRELAKKMGENGRIRAKKEFSPEVLALKLQNVIKKIV